MRIPFTNIHLGTRASLENPSTSLADPSAWFVDWLQGGTSASGTIVNAQTALTYSAYFCAVKILQESISSLPLNVFEKTSDGVEIDASHPANTVIHSRPNNAMTSVVWREVVQGYAVSQGNGLSEIKRNGAFAPTDLIPIDVINNQIEIKVKKDGNLIYEITPQEGTKRTIQGRDIIHIPGFSTNGVVGKGLLACAKDSIGLGLGQQEYASGLFKNGANPSGVIMHPLKLSKQAAGRLKDSWNNEYGGSANSQKTVVLEEGMKYEPISMTPEQTQLIESRRV